MPSPDWDYPETWQVGDNLDAATLNHRVRDQNSILLRRPMFVAHNAGAFTAANGDSALTFDTIDQDDDGMAMAGAPVSNIYAQREGTYQFWLNVTFQGNGSNCPTMQTGIWLTNSSATRRWDYQAKGISTSGLLVARSVTGAIFLNVGEYFTCHVDQNSGANMTLPSSNNSPRIAVIWLGIS